MCHFGQCRLISTNVADVISIQRNFAASPVPVVGPEPLIARTLAWATMIKSVVNIYEFEQLSYCGHHPSLKKASTNLFKKMYTRDQFKDNIIFGTENLRHKILLRASAKTWFGRHQDKRFITLYIYIYIFEISPMITSISGRNFKMVSYTICIVTKYSTMSVTEDMFCGDAVLYGMKRFKFLE